MSSYWRFIVAMALSCIIFELKRHICRKSRFFHASPACDVPAVGGPRRILPRRLAPTTRMVVKNYHLLKNVWWYV